MNFFLSPLATLTSRSFYREAGRQSLGRSFLYLLYLCVILNLALVIWFHVKAGPVLDQMMEQVIQKMPVVDFTEQGISIDQPAPYTVPLLEWGGQSFLNLTFDTAKERLTPEEMGGLPDAAILITQKAFYARQPGQGIRVIDFDAERQKNPGKFKAFTLDLKTQQGNLKKALDSMKRMGSLMAGGLGVIVFFVSGLAGALFYSLFGLLFNLTRKTKLAYGAIFNLAVYAMTPALLAACVLLIFHFIWFAVLAGGWINFLVTLGYLFYGVKVSEEEQAV